MIIIPQEVYIELFDQIDENLKAALQRDLTGFQSQLPCLYFAKTQKWLLD